MKIEDIMAHELSTIHTIKINTSTDRTAKVTISGLSYVSSTMYYYTDRNDADKIARNAAAALWNYSKAADAFKEAYPDN